MSNTPSVSAPSHAHLRFAIFEYLSSLIKSGNMKEEQTESLEVAVQCISEAFGFSTEEPSGTQHELSLKPLTLPVIFNTGVQVLSGSATPGPSSPAKSTTAAAGGAPPSAAAGAGESSASAGEGADQALFRKFLATLKDRGFFTGLTEGTQEWKDRESKALDKFNQRCNKPAASPGTQDTQRAAQEELRQRLALETKRMEDAEAAKTKGNALLSAKKYADAVGSYSEAVRLWPTNAVYYSNRAAAYTHMHMYDEATVDCRKAIELKPDFSKAYSRLGTVHFQAGRYKEALDEGYRKALELEPSNSQYKEALEMAETRLYAASAEAGTDDIRGVMSELGMPPEMFGMAQSMLSNPAFVQMAQGMMGNPDGMDDMIRDLNLGGGPQAAAHTGAGAAAGGAAGAATRRTGEGSRAFVQELDATGAAVGGASGGGEEALEKLIQNPALSDITGHPRFSEVLGDIRAHGALAVMKYMNDPEASEIYGRLSAAAGPAGIAGILGNM